MPKISIIIPVYNVEKYLREALDSVLNQTFSNWEAICVNDGSSDNSLDILNEYAEKDSRFIVINQKNGGVSKARNVGLEKSSGEYIMFLDPDDWLDLKTLEILYETANDRKCELLLFSFNKYTNNSFLEDGRLLEFSKSLSKKNTTLEKSYNELFNCPMGICGKFYKSSLLKKNEINFPIGINCGEDRVFFVEACINANTISVIDLPLYYYRLDTENSLTKSNIDTLPHMYNADKIIKKIILSVNKDINKKELFCAFWEISVNSFLYYWNNCYNHSYQAKNFKYLINLKKEYSCFSKQQKKKSNGYWRLNSSIKIYKTRFITKLLQPLIEIEQRRNRFVLYLFERQILNFSILMVNNFILNLRYLRHLIKLRFLAKFRKIRVGFLVMQDEKWSSQASIYNAMKNSKYFEPIVLLSYFKKQYSQTSPQEQMLKNIEFFKKHNIKYTLLYKDLKFLSIKKAKADILFYQQPWLLHKEQSLLTASKNSIICYSSYCFHSLETYINYLFGFHGFTWKYFVESDLHKKNYEEKYNAKNVVATGSPKLDGYKMLNKNIMNKIWKTKNKKRIIYAPHHSFSNSFHKMSTFEKNKNFILELAKKHPETEWIFRPHPIFKSELVDNNIMTKEEVEEYYRQWATIGTVYCSGDYYELFASSDCLITDCISFLSEYLPTEKPVLHLRNEAQAQEYLDIIQKISDDYYKIYNNENLAKTFEEVIIKGNDYLKEKRIKNIELLEIEKNKTAGEKIKEYIEKELWIKE